MTIETFFVMNHQSDSMIQSALDTMKTLVHRDRYYNRTHLDGEFMNSLRKSGTLCDIILIVEGMEFPVHKIVLAAGSPYFQAMFTSSFKEKDESRQEIHGISHETFSTILDYIYTSRNPTIKDDNVESLLEAACFLQLNYVKDLCLDHLKSMINTENFLEIRSFASRHSFTLVCLIFKTYICIVRSVMLWAL